MSERTESIEALIEFDDVQERIDTVADDFASGRNRFAAIDAWMLGELLGLNFDDTGDWSRFSFAYRQELEDAGYDHPFAENLHLLEGTVPSDRYQELTVLAESVGDVEGDLPLTEEEVRLIREAYVEDHADGSTNGIDVCLTTLKSSNGIELAFEVCIGDSGEACDAKSPYELRRGEGFKSEDYIERS